MASKTVLVVEDEPDLGWAIRRVLAARGFRPLLASSGREAVGLAAAHRPSWAVLDAKLPDADGLDLARRLGESLPGLRVLLVSAYFYGDDPSVRRAIGEGVIAGFLSKPFQNAEILRVLRSR